MLNNALIVSLSRDFWDGVWRSRQQVMSRLARTNTVVFVSRTLSVDEVLPWATPATPMRRSGAHRVDSSLVAYVPPRHLPQVLRLPGLDRLLERRRIAHLRRFVRRWGDRQTVLYLWHPSFERYIDAFPDSLVCYHLFDDLSLYGNRRDPSTEQALDRVLRRADIVFAASEDLAARYQGLADVHWMPNGVDFEAFSSDALELPPDLGAVPHPRLGYAGSLRAQIDLDLLLTIAGQRPGWSLVFVGDITASTQQSPSFARLRQLPNVYLLGQKTTQDMPAYVRHFDVGLLPYRLDGAGRFCYPLKMHEYLAAGLPIVSSDISAVHPFTSVIRVADSPETWLGAIEEALEDTDQSRLANRRAVAARNSWAIRVEHIGAVIAEKLNARRNGSAASAGVV